MDQTRGKTHGAFRVVPDRPNPDRLWPPMKPERYIERMLRMEARRMNFILLLAHRHFEARKFVLDLTGVLVREPAPLRRA